MIVVIPSIREINLDFIEPLLASDARVVVVDDTDDESIRSNAPAIEVLHYSDRRRMLGELEGCIPRKNGACRDLGLWYAYATGDDGEVVVCLDDDCIVPQGYPERALASLGRKELVLADTEQRFYNLLDIYEIEDEVYPRGFPYEARGEPRDHTYERTISGNVAFNLGLWQGVFDVNAIDKLYLDRYSFPEAALAHEQVAVARGALASLCSMNMIFVRELIPAIYQLPMNVPVMPSWTIDRYGDIWGGYICKLLMDIRGDLLAVGMPMIYHEKATGLETIHRNIRQEHYAHLVNVSFCELIVRATEALPPDDYLGMYGNFVENLGVHAASADPALRPYIKIALPMLQMWVTALATRSL